MLSLKQFADKYRMKGLIPYTIIHLACLTVIWTGVSKTAGLVCFGLYALRVFALTGFYHRYFSHKAFKMNRFWTFFWGFIGAMAIQRGPLWWSSHHRHHHKFSDEPEDAHSPMQKGFWHAHVVWFLENDNYPMKKDLVQDWRRFPELIWLDKHDMVPVAVLAALLFFGGQWLASSHPELGTNGYQLLTWGLCISTVLVYHVTYCINSLAHVLGTRRYNTQDDSRNHWFLALLAFGEGWHNNHHHYPASAAQGFFWWEIDITYYLLKLLSFVGIVKDIRPVPKHLREAHIDPLVPETD